MIKELFTRLNPPAKFDCEIINITDVVKIAEAAKFPVLKGELASPEILPQYFDRTMEGWLRRIALWGKITYQYISPYKKSKEKVTKNQMLTRMQNLELNRMMGKWEIKQTSLTSVEQWREFSDPMGKKQVEKYIVSVELSPELKKSLGPKWKFWR